MPKSSAVRSATASDILGPLLRRRVVAFRAREAEVRLGEPDAVHRFRVSARRLRSLLAAYAAFLDPATCKKLDRELRETTRTLAPARDAQIVQRRLESLLREEPDSRTAVHVGAALGNLLETSYEKSWQEAIQYFDGSRYDSFTRALTGFADLPPWTPAAGTAAKPVFVPVLRNEWEVLLRRGRRVQLLKAGRKRDLRLHDVRKAARRVKDVAQAQAPVSGRKVKRLGKEADRLQTILGEYQDLVITGLVLDKAGTELAGAGDVLHGIRSREVVAAKELYAGFCHAWRDADRKSLRAWMS